MAVRKPASRTTRALMILSETLDPILAAIEGASSYEEALAALEALPGLPAARVIDTLVKGMFRARALGDVRDE